MILEPGLLKSIMPLKCNVKEYNELHKILKANCTFNLAIKEEK